MSPDTPPDPGPPEPPPARTYDALGRITSVSYPSRLIRTTQAWYDASGRRNDPAAFPPPGGDPPDADPPPDDPHIVG